MTQETIKNFMKGNPKKLYEHFSRGCSIEELKSGYIEMRETWKENVKKEQKRQDELKNYKEARKEAAALLNQCDRKRKAEKRQKKLDDLEKWKDVPPMEAQYKKANRRLEEYKKALAASESKVEDKKAEIEGETAEGLEREMKQIE